MLVGKQLYLCWIYNNNLVTTLAIHHVVFFSKKKKLRWQFSIMKCNYIEAGIFCM